MTDKVQVTVEAGSHGKLRIVADMKALKKRIIERVIDPRPGW